MGQASPSAAARRPSVAATGRDRAQREITSEAVVEARRLALAAKALVPPPKGRLLRTFQKAEVQQKMAESKV